MIPFPISIPHQMFKRIVRSAAERGLIRGRFIGQIVRSYMLSHRAGSLTIPSADRRFRAGLRQSRCFYCEPSFKQMVESVADQYGMRPSELVFHILRCYLIDQEKGISFTIHAKQKTVQKPKTTAHSVRAKQRGGVRPHRRDRRHAVQ